MKGSNSGYVLVDDNVREVISPLLALISPVRGTHESVSWVK